MNSICSEVCFTLFLESRNHGSFGLVLFTHLSLKQTSVREGIEPAEEPQVLLQMSKKIKNFVVLYELLGRRSLKKVHGCS